MTQKKTKPESEVGVTVQDHKKAIQPAQSKDLAGPNDFMQMAMNKDMDIEVLKELIALKKQDDADKARKAFVQAMGDFKANAPSISKSGHVRFQNKAGDVTEYNHATLSQVSQILGQALSAHGLSHRWDIKQGDRVAVTCILTHVMGHSEQVTLEGPPDTSGGKNSIQAIQSTVTYLQRGTLHAVTGVIADNADDDGRGAEPGEYLSVEQIVLVESALINAGFTKTDKAFLQYAKVSKIEDILASKFNWAIGAIEKAGSK